MYVKTLMYEVTYHSKFKSVYFKHFFYLDASRVNYAFMHKHYPPHTTTCCVICSKHPPPAPPITAVAIETGKGSKKGHVEISVVLPMKGMESRESSKLSEPDLCRVSPSLLTCMSLKLSFDIQHIAPSSEPAFTSGGVL